VAERMTCKERAKKNLLCAINWDPEAFASFDHRLGGLLRSAVSLERRWSNRRFPYGYLVTTSSQSPASP